MLLSTQFISTTDVAWRDGSKAKLQALAFAVAARVFAQWDDVDLAFRGGGDGRVFMDAGRQPSCGLKS